MDDKKQIYAKRSLEELNLLDNFLFNEVVAGEEGEWFCRYFLKLFLGRDPGEVQIRSQDVIQGVDTDTHGIRIDLYVDEAGGAIYDLEPDKYTADEVLPRRARFYQALTDSRRLETGVDYGELRNLWVIFILPRDPFGAGRMRYTVSMVCEEMPELPYDDGLKIVYLNTKGERDGDVRLAQLLRYMEQSTGENAETEELQHLDRYVKRIKKRREVGVKYMRLWELEKMMCDQAREAGMAAGREEGLAAGLAEGLAEGRKAGRAEGREAGRAEGREAGRAEGRVEGLAEGMNRGMAAGVLELLGGADEVPETLRERITGEKDLEILGKWLKLAARAENLEEFENEM